MKPVLLALLSLSLALSAFSSPVALAKDPCSDKQVQAAKSAMDALDHVFESGAVTAMGIEGCAPISLYRLAKRNPPVASVDALSKRTCGVAIGFVSAAKARVAARAFIDQNGGTRIRLRDGRLVPVCGDVFGKATPQPSVSGGN